MFIALCQEWNLELPNHCQGTEDGEQVARAAGALLRLPPQEVQQGNLRAGDRRQAGLLHHHLQVSRRQGRLPEVLQQARAAID